MTELTWPAERPPPHPFQLAVRAVILASAFAAVAFTRAAAVEPLIAIEVAIVALGALGAVMPDSHVGLLVVVLIGVGWIVTVDDSTTAWVLGVAMSTALFHTSMSAASLSPAAARWTTSMRRRWAGRGVAQMAATVPVWLLVVVVARVEVGGGAIVMAGALITMSVVTLWARPGDARGGERSGV